MAKIRLEGLSKRYGEQKILHDINLSMEDNEFTVLVGPSGCGKSTTLRMVAGLESVSEGEIYINDIPISHLSPKDRDLAMVFQDYALYPHMNVERNMSFALRLAGTPKKAINAKIEKVSHMLGLKEVLHRKPSQLSGGQRQRVAMGRALVKESSVFLFDEPLSNLDAKLRGKMRNELSLLHQTVKKNMIYVTHDQIEAMTLADRIVMMKDGHLRQEGTPKELYHSPVDMFVAGFLGSPPMNFLEAELIESDGKIMAQGPGFSFIAPETKKESLQKSNTRSVILGIRPSELIPCAQDVQQNNICLDMQVTEFIGSQNIYLTRLPETEIYVSIETKSDCIVAESGLQNFSVNQESIHFFHPETEQAL